MLKVLNIFLHLTSSQEFNKASNYAFPYYLEFCFMKMKNISALQKSHKEGGQRTGLWGGQMEPTYGSAAGVVGARRENNDYIIELTPGWR